MSKCGRREVLDSKKRGEVLAILNVGCSRRTAANYVNCAPSTIRNTAERDTNFATELAKAENVAKVMHMKNIRRAGDSPKLWRASAWAMQWLEPEASGANQGERMPSKQLSELLRRITDMIVSEVPVDRYRKAIAKKLGEILRKLEE